ncbi:MAG: hypothetical protein LBN93_03955 [Candidatus Symbiothrix sp.]|nr:hypothetical protein [Candidatus Symbiothrix sp.]
MKGLFRSRNGHGIHSPFVFNLVTKVIETKNTSSLSGYDALVLRLTDYFECETVLFPVSDIIEVRQVPTEMTAGQLVEQYSSRTGENTLIIVDRIGKQPEMKAFWQLLQATEQATVSLDLKHLGMVFFNPKLPKKYYKIHWKN